MNPISRRQFVAGLAGAPVVQGLCRAHQPPDRISHNAYYVNSTPAMREFDLAVDALLVNYTGHPATAIAVNGSVPGPLLRWREGDTVTVRVANRLGVDTSHPLARHPAACKHGRRAGVELSRHPSRRNLHYRFQLKQAGTYWYHAHSSLQEAKGVYGAIVIEPRRRRSYRRRPRLRGAAVGLERRGSARDRAQAQDPG